MRSLPRAAGLSDEGRDLVREPAWYYDYLGALVTHGVAGLEPVSGCLGGSVISVGEHTDLWWRQKGELLPHDDIGVRAVDRASLARGRSSRSQGERRPPRRGAPSSR
ncbi:hypothetical protein ACFYW8_39280 [Streptomyces sp. NPDC002742]|uniref:hypothetical protein n=1 Tax=Streptomyces sp. NPDC002742 TaxID=3364663 RepID=UPI0036CFF7DB